MSEVKVNKISPRTNCGTTQLGDAGDTITVTGDLKSNSLKSASGSTITLGQSGDTIQLGCGATQTGFGRTGTVDWDTTAKTASFTAVSGNGYFVNTTSGAITVTLPAGSAGSIVSLKDYANTWNTNNVTVTPNGTDKINGVNGDATLNTQDQSVTLVYVDSTKGWRAVQDSTSDVSGSSFIVATGGTITCCGDFKIHTFTGPGTFCVSSISGVSAENTVSYMVVAGGASGGNDVGGGGGAGGFRENKGPADCYTASPLEGSTDVVITATAYPITVGAGGAEPAPGLPMGISGSNSVFSTITSAGGGGGGGWQPGGNAGLNGGSGGGGAGWGPGTSPGGSGNTPPVSPPQGNNGGTNPAASTGYIGGSGGGAGAVGANGVPAPCTSFNPVTAGATTSINGSPVQYARGGNGGGDRSTAANTHVASSNTGDGGGGAGNFDTNNKGNAGGSGIVIIRYKYQ